ncbi:MAG: ribonuclease P protein component [Planctomycetes bacterium GWF2_41_51]|nr:MAG: ribonuclease P protein component [Planctomycetes bacterium GWF2_41_51]
MMRLNFPKNSKIGSKAAFKAVFDYKLFARNDLITVYMAPNTAQRPRFAVSVSGRISPAVLRNRLKRIAREAFRLTQHDIPAGFDYLIIYSQWLSKRQKSDISNITLNEVRQGFTTLVRQAYKRYEKRQNTD